MNLQGLFDSLIKIHWAMPWALLCAALGPLLILWLKRTRRPARPALPTLSSVDRLPISLRQRWLWLTTFFRVGALVLLSLAIARPQLGIGRMQTTTDAVAIQMVVDRSGSMVNELEIDGRQLSRLDVVKKVLREFLMGDKRGLQGRPADLIGLVTFARFAQTSCPLVRDPHALADLVDAAQPAMNQYEDGTAIGDALALAAARLNTAERDLAARTDEQADHVRIKSKVIILLTDGEQNFGELTPQEAADMAREWGIRVHTIGIGAGTDTFQTVRDIFGRQQQMRVPSTVDEKTLQDIAQTTGGKYFRAQDGEALRSIYEEIDRMEKSTIRTVEYTDYAEQFMPLAAASALLLALEIAASATILRRSAA